MKISAKAVNDSFKRLNEDINKSDTTIVWDGTYNVGNAWSYVENVTNVIIQDGVEKIKSGAFCNCINLKSVTIPNSVKYIEHAAFDNCRSLESIVIPDSVKEISTDVFGDCVLLRNIQLSNSLTRIDTQAFMGCESLKSVVIPASVKYISYDAFQWCDNLEKVILENPNTKYEDNSFPEHTKIIKKGVNKNMKIRKNESINLRKAKRLMESRGYNVMKRRLREANGGLEINIDKYDVWNYIEEVFYDFISNIEKLPYLVSNKSKKYFPNDISKQYNPEWALNDDDADYDGYMEDIQNKFYDLYDELTKYLTLNFPDKKIIKENIDCLDCDATLLPESDDNGPLEDYLDPEEYEEIEDYIYSDGTIVAAKGSYLTIEFNDGSRFTLPEDYFEIEL